MLNVWTSMLLTPTVRSCIEKHTIGDGHRSLHPQPRLDLFHGLSGQSPLDPTSVLPSRPGQSPNVNINLPLNGLIHSFPNECGAPPMLLVYMRPRVKVYLVYLVLELLRVPILAPQGVLEVHLDCQWHLGGGKQEPETDRKQGIPGIPCF